MPNKPTTLRKWEKEFDKRFNSSSCFCGCMEGDIYDYFPDAIKELKSFIEELLISQNTELLQKIEGMKLQLPEDPADTAISYNHALDEVISLINQEK